MLGGLAASTLGRRTCVDEGGEQGEAGKGQMTREIEHGRARARLRARHHPARAPGFACVLAWADAFDEEEQIASRRGYCGIGQEWVGPWWLGKGSSGTHRRHKYSVSASLNLSSPHG